MGYEDRTLSGPYRLSNLGGYPKWNGPYQLHWITNRTRLKFCIQNAEGDGLKRERERKARTTLLMAIPEDHLAKFHKMTDAKDMWIAIKSRFGGNDESKKMQKYILKQQFEGFTVSNSDGIHKGYERFQSLLSQLEIHGAGVSTEDANQKFLRSLPSAWLQVSLIMRNKPGMDSLSFDDLLQYLRRNGLEMASGNDIHEIKQVPKEGLRHFARECERMKENRMERLDGNMGIEKERI
ncbi:hypothetical protein Tco_1044845 [Tanacetum coccineum]|uniref:Uncharacterized protein n=1 Tax=Tanacetum coccineum TaxID=301880 RepID=A0ABQ5GS49_9ASTR